MTADIHGSPGDAPQMPAAGSGPAPVPYGGPDLSPEPPEYGPPPLGDAGGVTGEVLAGIPAGNAVQESGYAHDVNAGLVTPFYAGAISPIEAHGDADAGGRDDVSGTVAGATGNAEARWHELQGDTLPQGSTIGDIVTLTPVDSDASVGPWGPFTEQQPPSGSFT